MVMGTLFLLLIILDIFVFWLARSLWIAVTIRQVPVGGSGKRVHDVTRCLRTNLHACLGS